MNRIEVGQQPSGQYDSGMRLIEAGHQLSVQCGDVANSNSRLMNYETRKIRDLTNNQVFWSQLAAIFTATTAVAGGAAGMAAALVPVPPIGPNGELGSLAMQADRMSKEALKAALNTIANITPKVGDVGHALAQGQATKAESERSLAQSCRLQQIQQQQADSSGKIDRIATAIQGVLSAQSRNE